MNKNTIKLTHTQSQVIITKELGELPQSDLSITVTYDPQERTVEEIVSVAVFNWRTLETTDITHIMAEQFDGALDMMIDGIDWMEEYRKVKEGPEPEPTEREDHLFFATVFPNPTNRLR